MSRRILVIDYQEYSAQEIKDTQQFINSQYGGIELLINPDKVIAICDIEYSYTQVLDIFGEAYISTNGGF